MLKATGKKIYFVLSICLICVLCVMLAFSGSNNLESKEEYRRIIGFTSMNSWATSMHLNEVVVSKAINKTVTERDITRIGDALGAQKRDLVTLKRMLIETYDREDLRIRDEMILPVLESLIESTDALYRHLKSEGTEELAEYFEKRDALVQKFNIFNTIGTANKLNER